MKKIVLLVLIAFGGYQMDAQGPRVLLLDLGGLFYKFSAFSYARELGLGNIVSYGLFDRKNPKGLEQLIFGVLNAVPQQDILDNANEFKNSALYRKLQQQGGEIRVPIITSTRTSSGRELPYLLSAFQAGHISSETALRLAMKSFHERKDQGGFVSDREARIVEHAIRLICTPHDNAAMNKELTDGIVLLKELAEQVDQEGRKKYILVALSNVDKESTRILEERFKDHIYDRFAYRFYSGDLGTVKPNDEAFTLVMDALQQKDEFKDVPLSLHEIIFMDDQIENITAAHRVGIEHAILYKNAQQAREELVRRGVLQPREKNQHSTLGKTLAVGAAIAGIWLAYACL